MNVLVDSTSTLKYNSSPKVTPLTSLPCLSVILRVTAGDFAVALITEVAIPKIGVGADPASTSRDSDSFSNAIFCVIVLLVSGKVQTSLNAASPRF